MAPGPSFPEPIPQSTRSDILTWKLPKPWNQYTLVGRSRAAWHTSFVVPELNLLLDAGLVVNKLRPKHIFLTHGHSDHTLLTNVFVKREDPPDIHCPAEMVEVLEDFVLANTMLNLGGLVSNDDDGEDEEGVTGRSTDGEGPSDDDKTSSSMPASSASKSRRQRLATHITHGLVPGDVVPLRRQKNVYAEAFACDHTVPCLGYVFSTVNQRLRPEYRSLPGHEIKALREAGVDVTAPHSSPFMAFLGDTTAAPLAADPPPAWLSDGIPVVVTECSFLYPEHRRQADRTKHTAWADLEPVVRRWPRTTFVLMHFSLRYSDGDIRRFFKDMSDPPSNIIVWIDGLDEGAVAKSPPTSIVVT